MWYYHSVMLVQNSLLVSSVKEQQQAPATGMDVLCHHFSCQVMACLTSLLRSLSTLSSPPPLCPHLSFLLHLVAVHICSLLCRCLICSLIFSPLYPTALLSSPLLFSPLPLHFSLLCSPPVWFIWVHMKL